MCKEELGVFKILLLTIKAYCVVLFFCCLLLYCIEFYCISLVLCSDLLEIYRPTGKLRSSERNLLVITNGRGSNLIVIVLSRSALPDSGIHFQRLLNVVLILFLVIVV